MSVHLWPFCFNLSVSATHIPFNLPPDVPTNFVDRDGDPNLATAQRETGYRSMHPGGAHLCMGDGSVRCIKDSINRQTWMALGTKDNGETISADAY